jgi:hypothetical protein
MELTFKHEVLERTNPPTFLTFLYFSHLRQKLKIVCKYIILHIITEFYTEGFSVRPNITSKFHTIAIVKSFDKQNNDLNKTVTYIHDLLQYQP